MLVSLLNQSNFTAPQRKPTQWHTNPNANSCFGGIDAEQRKYKYLTASALCRTYVHKSTFLYGLLYIVSFMSGNESNDIKIILALSLTYIHLTEEPQVHRSSLQGPAGTFSSASPSQCLKSSGQLPVEPLSHHYHVNICRIVFCSRTRGAADSRNRGQRWERSSLNPQKNWLLES